MKKYDLKDRTIKESIPSDTFTKLNEETFPGEKITGRMAIEKLYSCVHVWGESTYYQSISFYIVTDSPTHVCDLFESQPKIYVDIASFQLDKEYLLILRPTQ